MPTSILMPALSPTMEEGTLAKWLVKEGDSVLAGDVIAEIETDKATMEVEAVDEGVIAKILVNAGSTGVAVNHPIAVLLEEGEDEGSLDGYSAGAQKTPGNTPEAAPSEASSKVIDLRAENQSTQSNNGQRIFASPLARKIAKMNTLDLSSLVGTGPNGRIIRQDVEKALKEGPAPQSKAITTQQSTGLEIQRPAVSGMSDAQIMSLYEPGSYEIVPLDGMRKTIAKRLVESKQTIPHFYLSIECQLDTLLAARKRMNENSPKEGDRAYKLSVNDFIIKAMAMALQEVSDANSTWTEQGILRHKSSDIGVAVAIDGGLFTPVIRHAEVKSLSEISNEMKDLASRARNKRLAPHEYQGGTTSISNLGMFGIKRFDAVINPPHATILAVGAGEQRPVIVDDNVSAATMMSVTLSCDHRVVDGALGAELLGAFKRFIEEPVSMLV